MRLSPCEVLFQDKVYPCPVSMAIDLIGGRWKGVILYYLKDEEKRYTELLKHMPTITDRTLSLQLKQLEKSGFIRRAAYGDKPPLKVVYALTDLGKTLKPVLEGLATWSATVSKTTEDA